MSRISNVIKLLESQGKKALIPYITGGDPRPDWTVNIMHCLVESGADIIEVGIPFSDPMADGPVIQLACERALEHNVTLDDVLAMVQKFRETNTETPVVLMGYLNPIEIKGYENFARDAAKAGVDGALIVDLPPEEAGSLVPLLKENNLDSIFLIAPTTTPERIKHICHHSSGYVYYVSIKGVTGSATLDVEEVAEKVKLIQSISDIPVGVGFGIRDADSATKVSKVASGVIVGSVIVNMIAENQSNLDAIIENITNLVSSMRSAMDAEV